MHVFMFQMQRQQRCYVLSSRHRAWAKSLDLPAGEGNDDKYEKSDILIVIFQGGGFCVPRQPHKWATNHVVQEILYNNWATNKDARISSNSKTNYEGFLVLQGATLQGHSSSNSHHNTLLVSDRIPGFDCEQRCKDTPLLCTAHTDPFMVCNIFANG